MKGKVFFAVAAVACGLVAPQFVNANPTTETSLKSVVMQQEVTWEEIETSTLPEAVSKAIATDYSSFTIEKAYKGSDGTYKVSVKSSEAKYDLFYSEAGVLVKTETPTAE